MYDLLTARRAEEGLKIREDKQLGVHVRGLSRIVVEDLDSVEAVIVHGTHNRSVASTKFNAESSRSHAIFELRTRVKETSTAADAAKRGQAATDLAVKVTQSKVVLIDLAGSERSAKLGSKGKSLAEGNSINKSLTVLGRVIKSLVEKQSHPDRAVVVPFRESKLTAYLRESLGGNSRTTVLAACSPVFSNM